MERPVGDLPDDAEVSRGSAPVQPVRERAQASGHPPPKWRARGVGHQPRPPFRRPDHGLVTLQHQSFRGVVIHNEIIAFGLFA
jgi:hypothetical protein